MRAPFQARTDADAAQTDSAGTVARKRVLADNRPEAVAQRKLAGMMNDSPGVSQLRAQGDAVRNSPRMAAQRRQMHALFGGAIVQRQRAGVSSALVIQRQGHTDEWNNYTRAADAKISPGGGVSQDDLNRINPLIQQHIRSAADRYKDVHISYGSVIVISSPKALFHFSIDPKDATHSHFTFETYAAGRWLNDAAVWQSDAVKDVVSSPADSRQWLLEREGERGMKDRLVKALESRYANALHRNVQDADVDEIIAGELAKHDVMKDLNQRGGDDPNPITNAVPKKSASDAHWRAPPDQQVMPANTQPAPQDIQAVWTTMQQNLQARVNAAPPAKAAEVQSLCAEIVAQTDRILQLGAMIYRRLPGTAANTTLAMFSEAQSNRITAGTDSLDRRENAIRLMDNNPHRVGYQNGVAVVGDWA
jgi:hypothetical protein